MAGGAAMCAVAGSSMPMSVAFEVAQTYARFDVSFEEAWAARVNSPV